MPLRGFKRVIGTRWCVVVKYIYMHLWCSLSFLNIASNNISSGEGGKTYGYINELYPNGYHQYERAIRVAKSIYCRGINSYPDSLKNWNCDLVCYCNCRNMTTPDRKFNHQTWQLYFIFLNNYQSTQIMALSPLNMERHVANTKN